ncbi:MAG: HAMP domain-containing sensor histidine kinase [Pirellulaceae bacterium]|jgi:hypothetical protein|nr:HAMP domain-containing sensor histidine kinase [Pirellulaceae bacterium]MDP7019084.1 HAMP domain-containing sensor histidine kinase [Pirellulaceae bacterium]
MFGRLPSLVMNGHRVRLPLTAAAARALTTSLLLDQPPTALLQTNSALAIWAVCATEDWRDEPPSTWRALAESIQPRWDELLDWATESLDEPATSRSVERWRNWALRDWRAGCLADRAGCGPFAQMWCARRWLQSASRGVSQAELLSAAPAWFDGQRAKRLDVARDVRLATATAQRDSDGWLDKRPRGALGEQIIGIRGEWDSTDNDSPPDDISALVKLAASQRRLRELESFPRQLEQAKLASLKELAYGASHELNNPLANISTRSQSLLREEADPQRRRALATIYSQALRAHEMISDMMLFANPPRLNVQRVCISELIRRVVLQLTEDADRQGTRLAFDLPPVELEADVDPKHFESALRSLCWNGLEALVEGGEVEISLLTGDADADHFVVEVRDNGPGISAEVREHLFDPFYSGREAGRGLGLGLCKCWSVAQQHGGGIDVEANQSGGALVRLTLPIHPRPAVKER